MTKISDGPVTKGFTFELDEEVYGFTCACRNVWN